ncbi:hypothetical protein Ancab_002116 [Ancistrocladus abbreviatus]
MEGLQASFLCALVFLLVLLKIFLSSNAKNSKPKLPPSPPKLPIIGNLLQLGKEPHITLAHLADKLGPIFFLQLGEIPTVVVSSPFLAREVLKIQDLVFCNRPQLLACKELCYNSTDVGFSPYGANWRYAKKILTSEVLSVKRVQSYEFVRKEQLSRLVERISTCYPQRVNLTKMIGHYANDVICSIALGRNFTDEGEYDRHGFHEMLLEMEELLQVYSISEYFPSKQFMHVLTGYKSRLQKLFRRLDNFLNEIIEEHLDPQKERKQKDDLLDVLLSIQKDQNGEMPFTMSNVKANIADMFVAGTNTSYFTINKAMMELFMNPKMMKQAEEEVRRLAGGRKFVSESDLPQLHYLKAIVKETLRLHPPSPFLIPRESMEATVLNGYDIPTKTAIWVNVWAIGRDPKTWKDPDLFNPDRFIGNNIDFKGLDFEFLPFGSGRRICPGISFASVEVELALAQLLHAFDWEIPSGIKSEDLVVAAKPRFDFA